MLGAGTTLTPALSRQREREQVGATSQGVPSPSSRGRGTGFAGLQAQRPPRGAGSYTK